MKISHGADQPGFTPYEKLKPFYEWYWNYAGKVSAVVVDRMLSRVSRHEMLDRLVAYHNSLIVGGNLRIADVDWLHRRPGYITLSERFNPKLRMKHKEWMHLFAALRMSPEAVEWHDENGWFQSIPDADEGLGVIKKSYRHDPRANDPDINFSSLIIDAKRTRAAMADAADFGDPTYIVGDSHSRFLAGKDSGPSAWPEGKSAIKFAGYSSGFIGLHLGPSLAFSLNRYGSQTKTREKIESLIESRELPENAKVWFSFGEIDCRYHVCRTAEKAGKSISEVVAGIVENYVAFLDRMTSLGFRCGVWGIPCATNSTITKDPANPIYGEFRKRQFATILFNDMMEAACKKRGLTYTGLFDLVHDENLNPIPEYFCDPIHLSQRARPQLYKIMPDIDTPAL